MPIIGPVLPRRRPDAKLADQLAYAPRMLRADRAAAYLAMSTSQFLGMVADGEMPKPIKMNSMSLWDRLELDSAVEDWKERRRSRNTVDVALGIDNHE